MTKQIIAISHEIEDESTGAVARCHVIEYVSIDYKSHAASATLNGYVSKKAHEAGRNPLCSHTVTVEALPDGEEVSRAWLYQKVVEQGNDQSVFSGAELIEA
nr:MAG TPA: hypothetical protein [Caudoviricetes sp.]